jgi:hypothetical protein
MPCLTPGGVMQSLSPLLLVAAIASFEEWFSPPLYSWSALYPVQMARRRLDPVSCFRGFAVGQVIINYVWCYVFPAWSAGGTSEFLDVFERPLCPSNIRAEMAVVG